MILAPFDPFQRLILSTTVRVIHFAIFDENSPFFNKLRLKPAARAAFSEIARDVPMEAGGSALTRRVYPSVALSRWAHAVALPNELLHLSAGIETEGISWASHRVTLREPDRCSTLPDGLNDGLLGKCR